MLRTILICVVLAVATVAVYWPATGFDFVNLDDHDNVVDNKLVTDGVTLDNVIWAMRTSHPDYWRPLTWVSLMVDHDLQGAGPRGYHLTNILLHTINVLLAFFVLRSLTGAMWPSAFMAGAFALHPMHVESVAWITERKDVLSAMFGLLCIWMYADFARRGGLIRYLISIGLLGMGLMAKPMLVPLPFVLLLLDVWPLKRLWTASAARDDQALLNPKSKIETPKWTWLIAEKIPFLLVSAASCVMTMRGGQHSVIDVPLHLRLANAAVSYVQYIGKIFWPFDLAVYYPYAGMFGVPGWTTIQFIGAVFILIVVSVTAILQLRTRPWLALGWFWFLGMLAPVIGVLQVGNQGMADRFAYFPFIGLYIVIAFGAAELIGRSTIGRITLSALAVVALLASAMLTRRQLYFWRDTVSLYEHALVVTNHNWKMHEYYGDYLFHRKQLEESAAQFEAYLKIRSDDARTQAKLGFLCAQIPGRLADAVARYEESLRLDPGSADAHYNLAMAQARRGDEASAIHHLEKAIELDPANANDYRRALENLRSHQQQ